MMKNKEMLSLFLMMILVVSSFAPFVVAATSYSYSDSTNDWQASTPTLDDYYSGSLDDYWPILSNLEDDQCSSTTSDFIVAIPVGGCSPSIVTSDLLAEQNVPVFCQLSAIKVNPLIDVSTIKSISFKGDYPDEVAGISFHPARAAISSTTTLIGDPIEQNIGYVVIVLKKQANETDLEKYVSGMLTATISYDANTAFGTGAGAYYLETMSDAEWSKDKAYNSFWNGKGYLRALQVEENVAVIDVLDGAENVLDTVTLKEGETSGSIYYPGQYCTSSFQLKLHQVSSTEDSARLYIDGDSIWVRKGDRILGNKCVVKAISVSENDGGKVTLSCTGVGSFDLKLGEVEGAFDSSATNGEVSFEYGNKVYTAVSETEIERSDGWSYKKVSEKWQWFSTSENTGFVSDSDEGRFYELANSAVVAYANKQEQANAPEGRCFEFDGEEYCAVNSVRVNGDGSYFIREDGDWGEYQNDGGLFDSVDNDLLIEELDVAADTYLDSGNVLNSGKYTGDIVRFADLAEETTLDLVETYGLEDKENGEFYGEESLYNQIALAGQMDDTESQLELVDLFLSKYPNSDNVGYFEDLKIRLTQYDFEGSSHTVELNNEYYNIRVDAFKQGREDNDAVNVRINGGALTSLRRGKTYDIYSLEETSSSAVPRLTVSAIGGSSAKFVYVWSDENGNSKTNTFSISNGNSATYGGVEFLVVDTNIEESAYVSLIPKISDTTAEANFTFRIGIEERSNPLTPEKANRKIRELNASIEKWEDRLETLGNLVSGMKAACLGVTTVMTVKSLTSGADSIARADVMDYYEAKCREEGADSSTELGKCYSKYADDIESDVDSYADAVEAVNDRVQCAETSSTVESSFFFGSKVINTSGYVSELSSCAELPDDWFYSINGVNVKKSDLNTASDYQAVLLREEVCEDNPDGVACEIATEQMEAALTDNADRALINLVADKEEKVWGVDIPTPVSGVSNAVKQEAISAKGDKNSQTDSDNYLSSVILNNRVYVLEMTRNTEIVAVYDEDGVVISDENTKNVVINYAQERYQFVIDSGVDGSCGHVMIKPYVRYYETSNVQGFAAVVPFDLSEGWYAFVDSDDYDDSGEANVFEVCNVGSDGIISDGSSGGDVCTEFRTSVGSDVLFTPCPSFSSSEVAAIYSKAQAAIREANRDGNGINVDGTYVAKTSPMGTDDTGLECTDFMSVSDCNLMFNVCDPVVCPTSRCDMGGRYPVSDVVSTGVIGSIALCLPNFGNPKEGGVAIPVCLSGIHAGLDSYVSVLRSYRSCLQENVEDGSYNGICDEIHSIYMCDFFWGQVSPLLENLIPSALSSASGVSPTRGGAEYLLGQAAFDNLENSVDYFTNNYAESMFRAFNLQDTEEIGTQVCNAFVGTSMPTSASLIDDLLSPESPTQFYAQFSESPYSDATVPSTSQYDVYYHIYAGNDQGVQYKVYLANPPESSYYASLQTVTVDSGYIAAGESADETKDFTAPSGYEELCVSLNGQVECGFGKVSSSFALDYATQVYVEDQATTSGITSSEDCVTTSASSWGLVNLNLQSGVEDSLGGDDISTTGITRVCASANPSAGIVSGNFVYCTADSTCDDENGYSCNESSGVGICEDDAGNKQVSQGRWVDVGYCDNENVRCWLDSSSVSDNLETYAAVNGIDYLEDLVDATGQLGDLEEEYESVKAKLNSIRSKVGKLENEDKELGEGGEVSEKVQEIIDLCQEISGNEANPAGQGLNANKAEALAYEAELYRVIARYLIYSNPDGSGVGAQYSEEESEDIVNEDEKGSLDISSSGYEFSGTEMRTDRNNNPTAFVSGLAEQAQAAGAISSSEWEEGDSFESDGETYYTAKLIGDPVDVTIRVIDELGFYTSNGKYQRWSYIAMSDEEWGALEECEKANVIWSMYEYEGGDGSLYAKWASGYKCDGSSSSSGDVSGDGIILSDIQEGDEVYYLGSYWVIGVRSEREDGSIVFSVQNSDTGLTNTLSGNSDDVLVDGEIVSDEASGSVEDVVDSLTFGGVDFGYVVRMNEMSFVVSGILKDPVSGSVSLTLDSLENSGVSEVSASSSARLVDEGLVLLAYDASDLGYDLGSEDNGDTSGDISYSFSMKSSNQGLFTYDDANFVWDVEDGVWMVGVEDGFPYVSEEITDVLRKYENNENKYKRINVEIIEQAEFFLGHGDPNDWSEEAQDIYFAK